MNYLMKTGIFLLLVIIYVPQIISRQLIFNITAVDLIVITC